MKIKKVLLMGLSLVLVAALAIGGTVAYLTDTDSDANVMTLGNVSIEQYEYERVVDENGKWIESEYTGYGYTADEMQEFTQAKPALPAVYQDGTTKWDDRNGNQNASGEGSHQQPWSQIGAPGSNQLFDDSVKNVIDKFVFVKNTGKTDAYYRTIIAIECPEGVDAELIHTNVNGNTRFTWENIGYTEINGVRYFLKIATYNEILTPGEISRPSLLQVFLDPATTNEDCAKFGDTWEIKVLSQAVQADGFADAETALDEAFGEVTSETVVEWLDDVRPVVKVEGNNSAAVLAAINQANAGDIVRLNGDTTIAGYAATNKLVIDKAIILDLNGYTLTTECGWGGIDAKGGCSIINGTINHTGNTAAIKAFQVESIENVTINVTPTEGKVKGGIVVQEGAGCYIGSIKDVTITGATNGIETYRCGDRTDLAIGSMENVTIDATNTGILLSAPIGTVTNCNIEGDQIGVNMYLYGPYSVSMELVNSTVSGNTGIYAHDEVGKTNPGSLTLTYDAATVINGGIVKEFEDEVQARVEMPTPVSTADELTAALKDGGDAVLTDDVTAKSPVYVTGGTLDGAGNTIDFTGVITTAWPNAYAVTLGNGGSTVENLTVTNAGYAIGSTATTDDVYINNVTTDYVTYAINGNGNGTNSVYVTESTINGWISYSNIKLFSFDNCTLGKGNSYDGYLVVYGDTIFTDCTFTDNFAMCARYQDGAVVAAGKTVTFTNCSYETAEGTVKVTADNFKGLFMAEDDETDFGYLAQCNVVIDGVHVSW